MDAIFSREPGRISPSTFFASLTPEDRRTTRSLQALVDSVNDQAADQVHQAKFIRRHAGSLAASKSPDRTPDSSGISSGNTTEADRSDDEIVMDDENVPCYAFSLDPRLRPFDGTRGWCFGFALPGDESVDLRLLPPTSTASHMLYARQGYFAFDTSGHTRFWLRARHEGIHVDGRPLRPGSKMLLPGRARIEIGPYRFIFEFKVTNERAYQEAKSDYFAKNHGQLHTHTSTATTPSVNDLQIGEWRFHGVVGATARTVINAVSHVRSGEAVAAKRLQFGSRRGDDEKEDHLYDDIARDVGLHRYRTFLMEKHSILVNPRSTGIREAYLLWKPLALGDFMQFGPYGRWTSETDSTKRTLFIQVLLGLSALHEAGWIHRDLKPANLGVVALGEKPYAVIMDAGAACRDVPGGHRSEVGHCGTIGWLAPEVEHSPHVETYDLAADIWSMGAIAYFLFESDRLPWSLRFNMFVPELNAQDPSLDKFRQARRRLISFPNDQMRHLIGQMLEEDPRQRPTLVQVLAHPALKSTRQNIDRALDGEERPGEKRGRER